MADSDVEEIVSRVLNRLGRAPQAASSAPSSSSGNPGWFQSSPAHSGSTPAPTSASGGIDQLKGRAESAISEGIFDTVDQAARAARAAQSELAQLPLERRKAVITNMRRRFKAEVEFLANLAQGETGLGRVQDKIAKNHLAVDKTPGVEDVYPEAFSGDHGLTVVERAPLGVIGSITPSTNPSETIVNNSIMLVSGGNTVVFNPHPGARLVSHFTISLLNRAAVEAGGPANLMTAARVPTLETSNQVMTHPQINALLVTGGGAVVKAAMQSGKRAVCAGPGNPPVVVDETADLRAAARHVIVGHSTDNNIVCIAEKEVFVVDRVADQFMAELENAGAYRVPGSKVQALTDLCVPDGHASRECVGKNAGVILGRIGLNADDTVRCGFFEVDKDHPFVQTEQLMPMLPIVRVPDVDTGIQLAVETEHGYNHTAMMHSRDLEALDRMARAIQVSIFVKNGPCLAGLGYGGEGFTAWSIAGRTGEGLTRARTFTRDRRCVLKGYFRIV